MELELFASCLAGLEQALADELRSLGISRVRPLGGGVAFFCESQTALRACLWSRLASRIMLVVGRVNAGDADLLYAGAYDLPWENVLADGATMAVRAHGANDQLRNTRFTALKVKDAVADRMRAKCGTRPQVDTTSPRASIDVRVHERRATISLDLCGEALNRRPYLAPDDREDAALACSLAAAALAVGGWSELAGPSSVLVDPVCRDGITLIEAVQVACDCAPGLHRTKWGFAGWAQFDPTEWEALENEAQERFEAGLRHIAGEATAQTLVDAGVTRPAFSSADAVPRMAPPDLNSVRFVGASTSSPAISKSRDHVRRAGFRPLISVELGDGESMADLFKEHKMLRQARAAMVMSNLDSGSRADAPAHVLADEGSFTAACTLVANSHPKSTSKDSVPAFADSIRFVAIGAQDMKKRFGHEPTLCQTVGRGRVQTTIEVFEEQPQGGITIEVADLAGGAPHRVEVLEEASSQFAARLRKVFKERRKWATRHSVSCYRIYDADLPDYAVAIDWYTGAGDACGNDYLHIAEYAPPGSVDADKARRRFGDVLAIAPVVCGVRPDHVFSKTRVREKGGSQYRNAGQRAYVTCVEEGGHRFEVDLAGRLDTGIFLDHRLTRELIRSRAEGTRFLNLFAYTGTATVYAAAGGAKATTTVDLSQTYLDWAQRNMEANGFKGEEHQFVRGDVMRWITDTRHTPARFDLIFVDPPTFSNSKAMGRRTWDVQRDHVELLIGVSRLLARGGEAVFSCNLRTFKPNVEELEKYGVQIQDISAETIPEDFARNTRIHKCYLVKRL